MSLLRARSIGHGNKVRTIDVNDLSLPSNHHDFLQSDSRYEGFDPNISH